MPKVEGAQAVFRALGLLQRVAEHHPVGVKLVQLVAETALDRTTIYRLLGSLEAMGFVERDPGKRYRLGLAATQLGLASMNRAPIVERCRPMMQRLARATEDTVFLVVRNGDHGQCLHFEEGAFPVKALVMQVGSLRVLGVGSAAMALLATLPDDEIGRLYERHREELRVRLPSLEQLMRAVAQTRRRGYARTDDLVTTGVGGVGVSFEVMPGAHAAISVGAIAARMPTERRDEIAGQIRLQLVQEGWVPAAAQ